MLMPTALAPERSTCNVSPEARVEGDSRRTITWTGILGVPRRVSGPAVFHSVLLVSISMNTISWSPSLKTLCSAPKSL